MQETGEPDKKVVIYGGSFNPPHIAHQITVLCLLETCDVDEVWLMPCYKHAFDKELAPFDVRIKWLEALIKPFGNKCKITDVERNLPDESRTIDSLQELEKLFPKTEFSLAMGSDIRAEKHKWKNFDDLERKYKIYWTGRAGQSNSTGDMIVLPDISSTHIRQMLKKGEDVSRLVPKAVLELIVQNLRT